MKQTKIQQNNPHKQLALKATEKYKNSKLEFSIHKASSGGLFCESHTESKSHWINNYSITEYTKQVTNQPLHYPKLITNKINCNNASCLWGWPYIPGCFQSQAHRQFKYPAKLWKRGMPVLGHSIAVSKIPIIAITTNPGGWQSEV